ncbi:hypothetical protein LCGC14_2082620 [marine sediment metagenome]|uniref:Uncharacterized protein n=1 Tax=marine sediment metagenome TaxID=412755 RepID=A0A0F9F2D4_9ZZZZ
MKGGDMDSDIIFSKMHEDGSVTDEQRIKQSAIKACPSRYHGSGALSHRWLMQV